MDTFKFFAETYNTARSKIKQCNQNQSLYSVGNDVYVTSDAEILQWEIL